MVHEPWWNANARFADIILPVATSLERNDLAAGALDPVLTAMRKAVEPHLSHVVFAGMVTTTTRSRAKTARVAGTSVPATA